MMTTAADPLSGYVAVSNLINVGNSGECVDISYDDFVTELRNVSVSSPAAEGGRQWTYQTCAYEPLMCLRCRRRGVHSACSSHCHV
jgi:hypothetical protein